MANLTTAYATPFTPAVGSFNVQVTGGSAELMRRNNAGAAWAPVEVLGPGAYVIDNPIAGALYKFTAPPGGTTAAAVSADE